MFILLTFFWMYFVWIFRTLFLAEGFTEGFVKSLNYIFGERIYSINRWDQLRLFLGIGSFTAGESGVVALEVGIDLFFCWAKLKRIRLIKEERKVLLLYVWRNCQCRLSVTAWSHIYKLVLPYLGDSLFIEKFCSVYIICKIINSFFTFIDQNSDWNLLYIVNTFFSNILKQFWFNAIRLCLFCIFNNNKKNVYVLFFTFYKLFKRCIVNNCN